MKLVLGTLDLGQVILYLRALSLALMSDIYKLFLCVVIFENTAKTSPCLYNHVVRVQLQLNV